MSLNRMKKIDIFTDVHSGNHFIMNMANETATTILVQGIYEWPLIQWCEQFLTPDTIFVDIGAHMGTYSIHLAKFCKGVHAFEAQWGTYLNLCGGLGLNERFNVVPYHMALGSPDDAGKTLALNHVSNDGGGSTMESNYAKQTGEILATEMVRVRTLDSFNLNDVGFLKLNVEGWELNVLKGARQTLERCSWPKFIFEAWTNDWYFEQKETLFAYVRDLGYNVVPIAGIDNMFLAARD